MIAQDSETISRAGHSAFNEADALNRRVATLHSTPVTQADLILGGLPSGILLSWYREKLATFEALLKANPAATFVMHAQPESLENAVEQLRQAIANAEKYSSDRKR